MFLDELILESMALLGGRSHEASPIHRRAEGSDSARSGSGAGRRGGEEARELDVTDVRHLKQLEQENARLKKLLAERVGCELLIWRPLPTDSNRDGQICHDISKFALRAVGCLP